MHFVRGDRIQRPIMPVTQAAADWTLKLDANHQRHFRRPMKCQAKRQPFSRREPTNVGRLVRDPAGTWPDCRALLSPGLQIQEYFRFEGPKRSQITGLQELFGGHRSGCEEQLYKAWPSVSREQDPPLAAPQHQFNLGASAQTRVSLA